MPFPNKGACLVSRDECVKCGWPQWLQKLLQDFSPGNLAIRKCLDQKDADSRSFIHSPCQGVKLPRVKAGRCPSFCVSTSKPLLSTSFFPCISQSFKPLYLSVSGFLNETVYCIYCGTKYSARIRHLFQHIQFWLVFYDVVFLPPTCSVKVHLR